MNVSSSVLAALVAALVAATSTALADDTPVRLEARCPDKTIEYNISQHALAEIQTRKDYKVVADNSAEIIIRFSASPVKSRADDKGPPLGIALATLVQSRAGAGVWEVKRFGSAFVPLDEIHLTIKGVIGDVLK